MYGIDMYNPLPGGTGSISHLTFPVKYKYNLNIKLQQKAPPLTLSGPYYACVSVQNRSSFVDGSMAMLQLWLLRPTQI